MGTVILVIAVVVLAGIGTYFLVTSRARPRVCPQCQRTVVPGADRCPFCNADYHAPAPSAAEPPVPPHLIALSGPARGQRTFFTGGQFNIGRAENNALIVADPQVEPYHAVITVQRGRYVLFDYGTPNGTYVNGRRIVQHVLRPGDRIQIGSSAYIFQAPARRPRSIQELIASWQPFIRRLAMVRKISFEVPEPRPSTGLEEPVPTLPGPVPLEAAVEPDDRGVVKCYHCYSTKVTAVCHHCGRLLCRNCEARERGPFQVNYEFAAVEPMDEELRRAAHCRDHQHFELAFLRILSPAVVLLGVILMGRNVPIVGLPLALAGLALWAASPWLHQRLVLPEGAPHVPLFPRYQIHIKETARADFRITDESYLDIHGSEGLLSVGLSLAPVEEKRYRSFMSKYRDAIGNGLPYFDAGFIVLEDLRHVRFEDERPLRRGGGLRLTDIVPQGFAELCRRRQALELRRSYRIDPEALRSGPEWDREFPVWMTPSLRAEGAGRVLALDWRVTDGDMERVTLEELTIPLPPELVRVEGTDGHFDAQSRTVQWKNVPITADKGRQLWVEFAEPVTQAAWINGRYRIAVDRHSISGLDAPLDHMWNASGRPLEKRRWAGQVGRETVIEGQIVIDTRGFSYQREYTAAAEPMEHQGVAPDHGVLNRVLDSLAEAGVYVKEVVETPARVARIRDIGTTTRYWEITGRRYMDIQPVDVHVVLSGSSEELAPGDSLVKAELTLRSLLSAGDAETETRINGLRDTLRDRIRQAVAG